MARTDEERFKIQYIRLKREAEQRRLAEQEKIRFYKQLKVPIVVRRIKRPIQQPIRKPLRLPLKRKRVLWFDQWRTYFKDGVRRRI